MNQAMETAKQAIIDGATFAAVSAAGELYTSDKKGIAPIMELLAQDSGFLKDAIVADKVIGRAAALLLAKGGISKLYAVVISEHAIDGLKEYGIGHGFDQCVPYIINRTGDGMCPMEETVLGESDLDQAYVLLQNKIRELMGR